MVPEILQLKNGGFHNFRKIFDLEQKFSLGVFVLEAKLNTLAQIKTFF